MEFAADVQIPEGAPLGSINGSFGVVSEHETSFRAYSPGGARGVVLAYRGLLLKQKGWLVRHTIAEPKWRGLGPTPPEADEDPLAAVDYSDYL